MDAESLDGCQRQLALWRFDAERDRDCSGQRLVELCADECWMVHPVDERRRVLPSQAIWYVSRILFEVFCCCVFFFSHWIFLLCPITIVDCIPIKIDVLTQSFYDYLGV